MKIRIPWDHMASSNTRNQRRGGKAHGWGYKRSREAIRMIGMASTPRDRPVYGEGVPVFVELTFYPPDRRRRDVSNLLKVIFDGLQGSVYADDYQIAEFRVRRMAPDREEPGCVVEVTELADSG